MSQRFDICTPRPGKEGKTFWTRIGTAWKSDKGIQLVFDALPIPDAEGRCVANLFEPRDNSGGQQRTQQRGTNTPSGYAPQPIDADEDFSPF